MFLILLYLLKAAQIFLRFFYKNSQQFSYTNQLSCKIRSKFTFYRNSMIFDVSKSSFNCLRLSFTMFSQILFQTIFKITKHIPIPFFSFEYESSNVLFISRLVMSTFLMSHTFSERSFHPLQLLCFKFFWKTSFRASKQVIIGLGRFKSWTLLEFQRR